MNLCKANLLLNLFLIDMQDINITIKNPKNGISVNILRSLGVSNPKVATIPIKLDINIINICNNINPIELNFFHIILYSVQF